jgi:hypothetical protein
MRSASFRLQLYHTCFRLHPILYILQIALQISPCIVHASDCALYCTCCFPIANASLR